ncbi:MAG TPA: GGDEF domain-containing protein [Phycisphaerales bacterium]|nr:GGDEF domain-containing protein [Phycisphaerales bacterium]
MEIFLHRLRQAQARARRHKQIRVAFLMVGLKNKVKSKQILPNFQPLIRCEDTLSEMEKNVVGVILEDFTHLSDPLRVAQRLRETNPDAVAGIGVVTSPQDYENAEELIKACREAMTRAGDSGEICYADEEAGSESYARLKLEADLDNALKNRELTTYYQPIFNLKHGTLTGFEALVRWNHPERGLLLPGAFLDIAEAQGQLLKIDEFVLQQALTQIPIWNAQCERSIYVCANLASDHFLKEDHLTHLIKTLNTHPYSLNLLRIDVSEQVLFEKDGIESLKTLDMLDIGFNLDDFGVDSESFHCLGSFAFNSLKIDRALIQQMEDEVNAELIVAVLRIAKRMGMKTIAEGVVTHAQLEELRNLGCTEAQGFLFSEAVSVEEAGELINTEYRW